MRGGAGIGSFKKKIWNWQHYRDNQDVSMFEPALENEDNRTKKMPPPSYSMDENWVQEYIKQFGEAPSFF